MGRVGEARGVSCLGERSSGGEAFRRALELQPEEPGTKRQASLPVRVLTAKVHGFNRDAWLRWESLHGELASEAADGKQVFFPGVGHGIQDERPREVATIILELVNQKCGSAR